TDGAASAAGVSAAAAAELRAYATGGLAQAVQAVRDEWDARLADLRHRLDAIEEAAALLITSDPDQDRDHRALRAERRAVRQRIGQIGRASAHGNLVESGLLPNYALIDTRTALEATLSWEDRSSDDNRVFHSELREYSRPARPALVELAPGNSYYVLGYRHTISGLDIGSPNRPAYEQWRVCPACGYVRTTLAAEDTGRCPRCASPAIADAGNLFTVLRPTKVTAHDRRDDAKIHDDSDERDVRPYTTAIAVDVDPAHVEKSWRHSHVTFGVDYTRQAVIREFNLGVAHYDRPASDMFAGVDTRLSPFYTCTSCGGTTTDRPPTTGLAAIAPSTSASGPGRPGDRAAEHHRLWCRYRRAPHAAEHVPLILAHELRTEALRILVPAVTAAVEERIVSFAAALRLGIAARYGGDPDHLRIVKAVMPDQETGHTRRFLVVHDVQPGGTGYLHRISDPDSFRDVLQAARDVIADCRCVTEGKPACHRCLLRYARDREFPLMIRAEALSMLGELLEPWTVGPSVRTSEISLFDQVESELELRFLRALLDWGQRPDSRASITRAADQDGARIADLRMETPDGQVVHWRMKLQNTIRGTRPDIHFVRLDAAPAEVAVYLDGYRYHASSEHNRLADDADKRTRLRAHGVHVFQLTWDDVEAWRNGTNGADGADGADGVGGAGGGRPRVWSPYHGLGRRAARDYYQQRTGRDGGELNDTVWVNPVETLLAFLRDPDPRLWRARAEGGLAGLLRQPGAVATSSGSRHVADRVTAALRGDDLPSRGLDPIILLRVADTGGCPLVLIVDERAGSTDRAWSALVAVDDRPATIAADEEDHRIRWAAWLYWTNLVQFLDAGRGDGVQLALSALGTFDPGLLAVAEGGGLLSVARALPLDDETSSWLGRASLLGRVSLLPARPPATGARPADPRWQEVLDLLDPDEPGLEQLVRGVLAAGAPPPEIGYEIGDQAWQAEVAWPAARVAVLLGPVAAEPGDATGPGGADGSTADGSTAGDAEIADRDAAYTAAGWDARTATRWAVDELVQKIVVPAGSAVSGGSVDGSREDTDR
uniref:DUF1998 domain-containing protein n=1 Tax=Frankia sp. CiP1_Cm_nod1 TaxID=2897160 RepID=UPI002024D37F